jgi:hypothetical protein
MKRADSRRNRVARSGGPTSHDGSNERVGGMGEGQESGLCERPLGIPVSGSGRHWDRGGGDNVDPAGLGSCLIPWRVWQDLPQAMPSYVTSNKGVKFFPRRSHRGRRLDSATRIAEEHGRPEMIQSSCDLCVPLILPFSLLQTRIPAHCTREGDPWMSAGAQRTHG